MGSTVSIPLADVTFLDANHCPGAALLLFKIKKKNAESRGVTEGSGRKLVPVSNSQTPGHVQSNNKNGGKEEDNRGGMGVEYSKIFLHTGDMRYHPRMQLYPALQNIRIDKIFLDTTYAHPKHKVSYHIILPLSLVCIPVAYSSLHNPSQLRSVYVSADQLRI